MGDPDGPPGVLPHLDLRIWSDEGVLIKGGPHDQLPTCRICGVQFLQQGLDQDQCREPHPKFKGWLTSMEVQELRGWDSDQVWTVRQKPEVTSKKEGREYLILGESLIGVTLK